MSRRKDPDALTLEAILATLNAERTWWVSTSGPSGPAASPTWGVALDDALWFYGAPIAARSKNLAIDPRVVIHTEDGDNPLIVHGNVALTTPVSEQVSVLAEYRAKYVRDVDLDYLPDVPAAAGSLLFRIEPTRAIRWRLSSSGAMNTVRWRR